MFNNVGLNNGYEAKTYSRDMENAAKYALGSTMVQEQPGPFEGMGIMFGITGAMEAPTLYRWAKNAHNNGGMSQGFKAEESKFSQDFAKTKDLLGDGGWKDTGTYKQVWNNFSANTIKKAVPTGQQLAKLEEAAKSDPNVARALKRYKIADLRAGQALADSENAAKYIAKGNKSLTIANSLANGAVKPTGFFGKIGSFLGKITGLSALSSGVKSFAVKSPTVSSLLKFGKGNGLFLAIAGGVELFTQVIPSFTQLGAGKGVKQLAKSSVKVAASVGGWAAGAAMGAAIGSVIPGAGTVVGGLIGAACGFIGGCLGSWGASKVADAVVGKSELEIAKDKEAKKMAEEAKSNPQVAQQIVAAATQRLQSEGVDSPDAKVAFGSLKNLSQANINTSPIATPTETNAVTNPVASVSPQLAQNYQLQSFGQFTPQVSNQMFDQGSPLSANMFGEEDILDKNFQGFYPRLA